MEVLMILLIQVTHYSSFDRAVVMIKKLGFKAQCSKMDVKSAFRLLPMYQGEFDLLGFKIGN